MRRFYLLKVIVYCKCIHKRYTAVGGPRSAGCVECRQNRLSQMEHYKFPNGTAEGRPGVLLQVVGALLSHFPEMTA